MCLVCERFSGWSVELTQLTGYDEARHFWDFCTAWRSRLRRLCQSPRALVEIHELGDESTWLLEFFVYQAIAGSCEEFHGPEICTWARIRNHWTVKELAAPALETPQVQGCSQRSDCIKLYLHLQSLIYSNHWTSVCLETSGLPSAIWEAIRSQTFKCRRFTVSSVPCTVGVWVASRDIEWRKWTKDG